MAFAVALRALLVLVCGVGAAMARPSSRHQSPLSWQDASELVQASVAVHGLRERNGTGLASGGATFWPADQWQDDLTFLDPKQPSPRRREAEARSAGPSFLDEPSTRVLVLPDKKLAFCYIEKNACTQFNGLFNKINGKPIGPWFGSSASKLGFDLDVAELTRSNGWKWGVFLRDPYMRYLSAWGSKCVQNEDMHGVNCLPPNSRLGDASVEAFESNVLANYAHQDGLARNAHWANQTAFCGGLRGAAGYDLVQVLSGDVNAKVRGMLRMVGADESYVDEFFPPHSVSGHSSSEALSANDYYRKAEIRQKVQEMYAPDFGLPGLRA